MRLSEAPIRGRYRVVEVDKAGPLTTRLMEMGLIHGAEVSVIGRAPFGGALHVRLFDYDLAVRTSEAALIEVDAA